MDICKIKMDSEKQYLGQYKINDTPMKINNHEVKNMHSSEQLDKIDELILANELIHLDLQKTKIELIQKNNDLETQNVVIKAQEEELKSLKTVIKQKDKEIKILNDKVLNLEEEMDTLNQELKRLRLKVRRYRVKEEEHLTKQNMETSSFSPANKLVLSPSYYQNITYKAINFEDETFSDDKTDPSDSSTKAHVFLSDRSDESDGSFYGSGKTATQSSSKYSEPSDIIENSNKIESLSDNSPIKQSKVENEHNNNAKHLCMNQNINKATFVDHGRVRFSSINDNIGSSLKSSSEICSGSPPNNKMTTSSAKITMCSYSDGNIYSTHPNSHLNVLDSFSPERICFNESETFAHNSTKSSSEHDRPDSTTKTESNVSKDASVNSTCKFGPSLCCVDESSLNKDSISGSSNAINGIKETELSNISHSVNAGGISSKCDSSNNVADNHETAVCDPVINDNNSLKVEDPNMNECNATMDNNHVKQCDPSRHNIRNPQIESLKQENNEYLSEEKNIKNTGTNEDIDNSMSSESSLSSNCSLDSLTSTGASLGSRYRKSDKIHSDSSSKSSKKRKRSTNDEYYSDYTYDFC